MKKSIHRYVSHVTIDDEYNGADISADFAGESRKRRRIHGEKEFASHNRI